MYLFVPLVLMQPQTTPLLAAVATGDFSAALQHADTALQATPESAVLHQLRGILLVALGRMAEAEAAFTHAIERGPQLRPTPSGLEPFLVRGKPLYEALVRQKAQLAGEAGIAAARNNRGAVRLLLRQLEGATEDTDQAAVLASDWGVPWGNGALIWLERGEPTKALESARQAQNLGEQSAWILAVLAESERQTGQLARAQEHLTQALERDATLPLALWVRSQVLAQQAKTRESERALSQALALSPETAAESRFVPRVGSFAGILGNQDEQHLDFLAQGVPGKTTYRVSGRGLRQRVEGRNNGDQSNASLEAIYGRRDGGTLLASFQSESGGRPGAVSSRAGVDTATDLRFAFQRTSLRYQHRLPEAQQGRFLVLAGLSQSLVEVQPTPTLPRQRVLREETLQAELRWDSRKDTELQAGLALAQVDRQGERTGPFFSSSPIEPSEQVLTNGKKQLGLAYALRRFSLTPNVTLTAGAVTGLGDASTSVQPLADLAIKVIGNESTHLRIRPRLSELATGLFPLAFLADAPQNNPIDRQEGTAHSFNRTPTLTDEKGRFLNSELALPRFGTTTRPIELALFQNRLDSVYTQATDARLAPGLALTPISRATARGIRSQVQVPLSKTTSARLQVRFQETDAKIEGATYTEATYPAKLPQAAAGLPNFPRWQAEALVEGTVGSGWKVGLEGAFVGKRPGAFTVRDTTSGELSTYLSTTPEAIGAHLHLVRSFGKQGALRVSIFNLGRANFYPGYPAQVTTVAGWDIRF